ncbi:MAG: HAD family hydrolase [Egibacteraceae bacterium]
MPAETGRARLVLWDIDRTLICVNGLGRILYREAFEQVIGRPLTQLAPTTGRTDPQILLETMRLNGVDDGLANAALPAALERLECEMSARRETIQREGVVLPGVFETLTALQRTPGVIQSVLTGNIKANAVLKLAILGLDTYLDLDVGAYGSDDPHRPNLVDVAKSRAKEKYGVAFCRDTTVLVGDSPLDVEAALLGGATIVAVATGLHRGEELLAAGADRVLEDLRDTSSALQAILTA